MRINSRNPCPACRGIKFCKLYENNPTGWKTILICMRQEISPPGWKLIGVKEIRNMGTGYIHVPEGDAISSDYVYVPPKEFIPTVDGEMWNSKFISRCTDRTYEILGEKLGGINPKFIKSEFGGQVGVALGEDMFYRKKLDNKCLGVGGSWESDFPKWAFTFAERWPDHGIVGFSFRDAKGRKGFSGSSKGCTRGLFIPDNFSGWKYACEGASDTIALSEIGFEGVVGRPSNSGGTKRLAMCASDGDLFVYGENDEGLKKSGKVEWPGKTGAEGVAFKLNSILDREVSVVMPPLEFKDAREWCSHVKSVIRSARGQRPT